MNATQLTGIHNLAVARRDAAERGIAKLSDSDLRDLVLKAKPNTAAAELAAAEVLVRACTHRDLDRARERVALARDVDALRRAWRRESDGSRRVLLLSAIEARGRELLRKQEQAEVHA